MGVNDKQFTCYTILVNLCSIKSTCGVKHTPVLFQHFYDQYLTYMASGNFPQYILGLLQIYAISHMVLIMTLNELMHK